MSRPCSVLFNVADGVGLRIDRLTALPMGALRWCADCPQRPSKAVVVFIVSKCECGMSRKPCFLRPGAEPRELPRYLASVLISVKVKAVLRIRESDLSSCCAQVVRKLPWEAG